MDLINLKELNLIIKTFGPIDYPVEDDRNYIFYCSFVIAEAAKNATYYVWEILRIASI